MVYAPVVLFCYNRADKLESCLYSLEKNTLVKETDLILFADGPKNADDRKKVEQVRCFINQYQGKSNFNSVKVISQSKNLGLANSIISGVSMVINEYKKVIVVEDDLMVSDDFLLYMNQALDYYEGLKEYGSVSGYTYPLPELKEYGKDIYATRKGECWGWGTWIDRWREVDWAISDFSSYLHDRKKRKAFDAVEKGLDRMLILQQEGKIDSWAVRWCYHLFTHHLLTVYPRVSKTQNMGFDGSGTNCEAAVSSEKHFKDDFELIDYETKYSLAFERLPVNFNLEKKAAKYAYASMGERIVEKIRLVLKN